MKLSFIAVLISWVITLPTLAGVTVDIKKLGKSLGGWDGRKAKYAQYEMADNHYRTFKPTITPTPEGGLFVSIRIDHLRGLLASDDHAVLETTFDKAGKVVSTRSIINVQGRKITSDLIAGGVRGAGRATSGASPAEVVVSLGSDLVANLTEKLSRETNVEPGRVVFPSVVQHNFNFLYQAITVPEEKPEVVVPYRAERADKH